MWKAYEAESYLDSVVECLRDTLVNHCKAGERIQRSIRQLAFRFTVVKNTRRKSSLRVEGGLGKCNFIFRLNDRGAIFSSDYYSDAENTFRQFVAMMDFYRRDLGLEPIDLDSICEIVEEDSPPVGAGNYALFDGADSGAFQDLLRENFTALAHREISGKYSIIVYSENARATKYFCRKNTPVYKKILEAFAGFYGFKDAMLVCVRRGKEQHIYFYAQDKGIFYNTQDASQAFLEREHGFLAELLKNTVKTKGAA
jgi:hypothetical protein